jgi:hypothetical protein
MPPDFIAGPPLRPRQGDTSEEVILALPVMPRLIPVASISVLGSIAGVVVGPTLAAISLGIVGPHRLRIAPASARMCSAMAPHA